MTLRFEHLATGLQFTARERRDNARMRALVALVALTLAMALKLQWAFYWVAGFTAAQGFELWALAPFRKATPPASGWRYPLALTAIFLMSASAAAVAVPMWIIDAPFSRAAAMLLIAGSLLNVLTMVRGSATVFLVSALPYFAVVVGLPVILDLIQVGHVVARPFIFPQAIFIAGVVVVWRRTERLARTEAAQRAELEARRAQAEAATTAKSSFIAMISHELRTPLTAELAAAQDMQRHAEHSDQRERAELIADAGRMMRVLLDDLLDLAKIEAQRMRVESVAFEPRALMGEVTRFWSAEAARKGLALTLDGVDALPERANGDPLRLRQILNNLLSNAVKFTEAGGVRIQATSKPAGDSTLLTVKVFDTGPGLTSERQARLFQPFEQTDGSVARTHGGTGLGLAISRELARLLGGDLTAASHDGDGACFTLTARLAKAAAAPVETCTLGPLRILVVDDHAMSRRALALMLEPTGAMVTVADSAEHALDQLKAERFDVVLMDVNMAGLDGLTATRRLRAHPGPNRATPVLAVTGATETKDIEACFAAGMNG
ncbi:MAG: ATP-binding protein, partial [Caulobacteraceae bacterium]